MIRTGENLGARLLNSAFPLFGYLDDLCDIMGMPKEPSATDATYGAALWPFLETSGLRVAPYRGSGNTSGFGSTQLLVPSNAAASVDLANFSPVRHPSGICSYAFTAALDYHLAGVDEAALSFGDATVDEAFSLGCWFMPYGAGIYSLISKYRTTAATAREYDFSFAVGDQVYFELYDEGAAASEIAVALWDAAPDFFDWHFLVATYDGNEASPTVKLYAQGEQFNNGTTTETGAYVAMENTTTPILIGARNYTGAPAQEADGRIALPFICNKELSAAEVRSMFQIGKTLLGLETTTPNH